ncbi:MAG: O-antigen ligase family protein [Pseudomonadales bacterium]|nr:O-antigen ligase family protein [Pseudomonadales bacterium]
MPVLMLIATMTWLANKRKFTTPPQHKLLPFLIVWMFISTAFKIGFTEASDVFAKFMPVVILYYLIVDAIDKKEKYHGMFKLMILAAVVMSLHSIQQSIEGVGWTGMDMVKGRVRYVGIFADPNDMGLFFLTVIPMTIYLLLKSGWFFKLIYLTALGLILYAVFLTQSRGTTLGIAALAGLFCARKYGFLISAGFGAAALIVIMGLGSRVAQIDPGEASAKGRVDAWEEGYYMTRDNPILGVGVGGFVIHHYRSAHNSWVLAMAELGIPGYFIWNCLMILSVGMTIRIAYLKPEDHAPPDAIAAFEEDRRISIVFLYSFVGLCFASFFLSRSYNIFIYTIYALSVSQYINMTLKWPTIKTIDFGRWWFFIFIFSVASVIGFFFLAMLLYSYA